MRVSRDDQALGLHRGIERELQLFAGEENRNAGEIHQTTSVVEVGVGEDDPADFLGVAADETHEFGERDFRSELAGEIFGHDAGKERVGGDFVIEVHGVAGVDEEIAGGMLDEDAAGGHGERVAGEGAAGFDPAGGEALEGIDGGGYAGVRWSGGQGLAMEVQKIGADAEDDSKNHKQDGGAT